MSDQRKLKRWHLIYYLRVFEADNRLLGHIVDITTEGFMLISERRIPIDKEFKLRMDLPAQEDETRSVEFTAMSLWTSQDVNRDFYDTGFQLMEPDAKIGEVISDLIETLNFPGTPPTRMADRYLSLHQNPDQEAARV